MHYESITDLSNQQADGHTVLHRREDTSDVDFHLIIFSIFTLESILNGKTCLMRNADVGNHFPFSLIHRRTFYESVMDGPTDRRTAGPTDRRPDEETALRL